VTGDVRIAGTGERVGGDVGVEVSVRGAVQDALAAAKMVLNDVDLVVTVGSDILDGGMVGTRSGIAGAYGRELISVPSSGGHALAAAVAMIESGQARTVLLAGWGEGKKFSELDGRYVQADPFYARPLGADAVAMSALQAQRVLADGKLVADALDAYGDTMRWRSGSAGVAASSVPPWLRTHWTNAACALVLTDRAGSVRIADIGHASHGFTPDPLELDPAVWVGEAIEHIPLAASEFVAVEVAGPTSICEAAALKSILSRIGWRLDDSRVNVSGGGAFCFFGPATGLRQIAHLAKTISGRAAAGVAIDLAGPIGQLTTVVALRGVAA